MAILETPGARLSSPAAGSPAHAGPRHAAPSAAIAAAAIRPVNPTRRLLTRLLLLGFLALVLVLPLLVTNPYHMQVVLTGFIFAIGAYGLNIALGYTGLLSLGHAGFFGIGAYAVALLTSEQGWSFWPALVVAIVMSGGAGFIVGSICLRAKGHYLAIFTLAVGMIIYQVLDKWESLTNGPIGVVGIPGPSPIGPITFDSFTARYYLTAAFLLVAMLGAWRIRASLFGRTLLAIRMSEPLAAASGVNVMAAKRLAFTMACIYAGVAGGLYASFIGFLGPDIAVVENTFNMLLYVLLGGIASVAGPLVGTMLVYTLTQFLQAFQTYQMLVFGPALIALVIFLPYGITGAVTMIARRLFPDGPARRGTASAATSAPQPSSRT
ncbi:branched-chain amino acid ABC transporter permease [Tistrella bauzanensis]|uniref:Branched-chain amino acid ABC transporter permease n=1 Tax=Tistrella bauzanensis TaxID=657419 RepID=A0ABQ1IBY5_9PROT|nr:branched-chain amino acid ABC transporter permease [Tistrella bauzanensis]GGB34025.1 branched-chain amino acid ABC transporter permease [Tistrella bauzanensis]